MQLLRFKVFIIVLITLFYTVLSQASSLSNSQVNILIGDYKHYLLNEFPELSNADLILKTSSKYSITSNISKNINVKLNTESLNQKNNKFFLSNRQYIPYIKYVNGIFHSKAKLLIKVAIFQPIAISKQLIKQQQAITSKNITFITRNRTLIPKNVYTISRNIYHKEAKFDIAPKIIITDKSIIGIPTIRKNHIINVHYISNGLKIKAKAVSLENGVVGQSIRIQNINSKIVLEGIVIDKYTVQITDN